MSNDLKIDEATFSNFEELTTNHFNLDIEIDFDQNVFRGNQTLYMQSLTYELTQVVLDIKDLTIFGITDTNLNPYEFYIDNPNPILGQRLSILIPKELQNKEFLNFTIQYQTSPEASAISWLTPEQTSGKKLPYMFTQSESIHARSLAPFQDTPSVKSTYTVDIATIPAIVTRVSGNLTEEYVDSQFRHTSFEMNIPVQCYLLAIASGNLAERKIGERTSVITEPEELDKVANEFSELEEFLIAAENVTIPYQWGDYKLLVLPPSFPFGGMENPLLTFASPTIVPGDKSSVDVAIHEIAHSWFGNLVTNNNWTNFWLNEGFTEFLERRVVRNIFGEDFMKITSKLENQSMYFDMLDYGLDHSYTSLHPIFDGDHPDDAFSSVPYEKGFQLLMYIETVIGEDLMTEFFRSYLRQHEQQSIGVSDFIEYFRWFVLINVSEEEAQDIFKQIDFDEWIYSPGLPPVTLDFETKEYYEAIDLAQSFMEGDVDEDSAHTIFKGFTVNLKGIFISHLIDNVEHINATTAQLIEDTLQISEEINGEVTFRWLQVAIRSGQIQSPYNQADDFVGSVGRMKYVFPVYQSLVNMSPEDAVRIFEKHRNFYHPIAKDGIQNILSTQELISY